MDRSQVLDLSDDWKDIEFPEGKTWIFQHGEEAPDLFFATENEACAAQQGWRIARGFHPITGEPQS